jgi:hypothetical protein
MDLTVLPTPMRATVLLVLGLPADTIHLCDACRATVFREQYVGQEAFYAALGAPPDVLAVCRGHDDMHRHGKV